MDYIKHDMVSKSSKRVLNILERISIKSGKKLDDFSLLNPKNVFEIPRLIKRKYAITHSYVMEHSVVTMEPKDIKSSRHIIYFHGGAYVKKGIPRYWMMLDKIVNEVKCKVTYIDYPIAPMFGYKDTHAMVTKTYNKLVKKYSDDDFIFMGDSAGGGLALAFAQSLVESNHSKQPIQLVLFSPWVDLNMDNENTALYEQRDWLLSKKNLENSAKSYAKGDDLGLPLLSPINGSLMGLPPIEVYVGTHELLYPFCIKFNSMAKKAGAVINTYIYENMPHVWIVMPFREAKTAVASVIAHISEIDSTFPQR